MKLLEIKNNLVRLSYEENEFPAIGRFIILASEAKSYVAQFVNFKSDTTSNFAIARLLFTFTPDGVVDNYDGSIPNITSEVSNLPAGELLSLLPIETPLKIGELAQQGNLLTVDMSIFEHNLTVFSDKIHERATFISNCVRQIFQIREKSVIIDTNNIFEDYPKVEFTKDFKLPLNSTMIDYIFEYELTEVDAKTKAVIQDIFYAVQQYIKTLDFEFLPINNFVNVVAEQYKELQMPELALLKNKLLKYRDADVFANTKEEVIVFNEIIESKNCAIIDLKNIHESLQKEVIKYIHQGLNNFKKYIYLFVPLTNQNSDKQMIKQFLNNNHVFTTILTSSDYKYAKELKQNAQNLIFFTPQDANHDFADYATFLSKLNENECVIQGLLTQGIPFIVRMEDLNLDLTKDDILGEKYQFVPQEENLQLVKVDKFGEKIPVEFVKQQEMEPTVEEQPIANIPEIVQEPVELVETPTIEVEESNVAVEVAKEEIQSEEIEETNNELTLDTELPMAEDLLPVDDIEMLEQTPIEDYEENTAIEPEMEDFSATVTSDLESDEISTQEIDLLDNTEVLEPTIDLLDDTMLVEQEIEPVSENLTEDDLNYIDSTQEVEAPSNEVVGFENFFDAEEPSQQEEPNIPVFEAEEEPAQETDIQQGDSVSHIRYGRGVVEKIINYGNKTLFSIRFNNVGRRLLDPAISNLTKL